jgi:hypothetical protein
LKNTHKMKNITFSLTIKEMLVMRGIKDFMVLYLCKFQNFKKNKIKIKD